MIIAPSILSADFADLRRDVEMLNNSQADWIHVDIMDGVFVPNISFGLPVTAAINKVARKPLDVHLMIVQPEKYLKAFKEAGASIITVHAEACVHLHRVIQEIKDLGIKAGVAINPHTPVSVLENIITDLDIVLVMSVNPGFGGQKFISGAIRKVKDVKALIGASGSSALIEVDGGVNDVTGKQLAEAGADALVAGNYVFASPSPKKAIEGLKTLS